MSMKKRGALIYLLLILFVIKANCQINQRKTWEVYENSLKASAKLKTP